MWYVINKQNGQKLVKFKKKVIMPLFEYMLMYKRENKTGGFVKFLQDVFTENKKQRDDYLKLLKVHNLQSIKDKIHVVEKRLEDAKNLIYICNRRYEKHRLVEYVDLLLSNFTKLQLEEHICVYYLQNRELKKRKSFIKEQRVPDEWNRIFTDFFYEKFFSMPQIWNLIDGESYTRDLFHDNFKDDNKIFVCPYCDLNGISDNGNLEVEHFWPGAKYPFLSLNPLNLYSSCKACNRPATGKGVKTFAPMTLPFYEQIGDSVQFRPDVAKKKIHIKGKTIAQNNYIKLINLENRYSQKSVYTVVEVLASTIYETVKELESHGHVVSDKDIENYVSCRIKPKVQPHYFVTADILRDYNKYLDFVNKSSGI